jgi:hypothetical protein
MSAEPESSPFWLRDPFWSQLKRVESKPVRLQSRHEHAGFDAVWQQYCQVIRELDMTTEELAALHTRSA